MKKIVFLLLVIVSVNSFCADFVPDRISLDFCMPDIGAAYPEIMVKSGIYWDIGDVSIGPTLGYCLVNVYGKEDINGTTGFPGSLYSFTFGCKLYYHFPRLCWLGLNAEIFASYFYEIWEDKSEHSFYDPFGILLGISVGPVTASLGVASSSFESSLMLVLGVVCPLKRVK
ncbi:MAG: hypothetical protein JW874_16120 [Spirochaetales bacterium]|nr:hypothetical protein [Spirochaetales bacterium]